MAELQFSGSRRDLALEEWVQPLCVCARVRLCARVGGWVGGGGDRGKTGKRKNLSLALKMNEKMGNPRVTA